MVETQYDEKKSLRLFTNNNPDWRSLAKDCVCFANARGGTIAIGIEDKIDFPPSQQKMPEGLDEIIRKRISELTINVGIYVSIEECDQVKLKQFINDIKSSNRVSDFVKIRALKKFYLII